MDKGSVPWAKRARKQMRHELKWPKLCYEPKVLTYLYHSSPTGCLDGYYFDISFALRRCFLLLLTLVASFDHLRLERSDDDYILIPRHHAL